VPIQLMDWHVFTAANSHRLATPPTLPPQLTSLPSSFPTPQWVPKQNTKN